MHRKPTRIPARPSRSKMWIGLLGIPIVAGVGVAFPTVKRTHDEKTALERTRDSFPAALEPFPELDGDAFLLEQHTRCFDENYGGSWLAQRLDRGTYTGCLDVAYARRVRGVAVLEDPVLEPHSSPTFVKLSFMVRVLGGRLPQLPMKRSVTECGDGSGGGGEGPTNVDLFEKISDGVYRVDTLEGLKPTPCRLRLSLDYGRWPLADPLELDLPAWDPVAKAADDERHRRLLESMDGAADCVRAARSKVPRTSWGAASPALQGRIRALEEDAINARSDAARDLARMGPEARAAVPALLDALLLSEKIVVEPVIEALPLIAPEGRELAPVLHCLLQHPYSDVRTIAALSLTRLGDARGTKALGSILSTPDEETQLEALSRIRDARSAAKPVLADLRRCAVSDPSPAVRKGAIGLLPVIDPESAAVEETLRAGLGDPDPAVREEADSSLRYLNVVRAGRERDR